MIIKPSDLEKMVKDRQDQEAAIVQGIYDSLVPEIDGQLTNYSHLFEEGKPIEIKIEDDSAYTDKVIQKIVLMYGTGHDEDCWDIRVGETSQNDCKRRVKLYFSPRPKPTIR